jgi:hypothetical protein
MLKHRPFKVEGDIPLTRNPILLSKVKKAFEILKIYQPFGALSSLGIKESIKILHYYSDELKKAIFEKNKTNIFETQKIFVSEDRICLGDVVWHVGDICQGIQAVSHQKMTPSANKKVPKISPEILKLITNTI